MPTTTQHMPWHLAHQTDQQHTPAHTAASTQTDRQTHPVHALPRLWLPACLLTPLLADTSSFLTATPSQDRI